MYNKHDLALLLADIVRGSMKYQETPSVGCNVGGYWLTPSTCWNLAKTIESSENEIYGEGNWNLNKEVVEFLLGCSHQNLP